MSPVQVLLCYRLYPNTVSRIPDYLSAKTGPQEQGPVSPDANVARVQHQGFGISEVVQAPLEVKGNKHVGSMALQKSWFLPADCQGN